MQIRPLRDRMVVRPLTEQLSKVIEVVSLGQPKYRRGEVVAIGPKVTWGTKTGDTIQFTDVVKYPSIKGDNGETLLILQEADVCFIEEREDERAAA